MSAGAPRPRGEPWCCSADSGPDGRTAPASPRRPRPADVRRFRRAGRTGRARRRRGAGRRSRPRRAWTRPPSRACSARCRTPPPARCPRSTPDGRPVPGTGIRKFVDPLPLPGQPATAGLGARLPVAVPDTITLAGLRLLRDRPPGVRAAPAPRPAGHPAARLPPAQPGHRRRRPQHGRPAGPPLAPRPDDRGAAGPPGPDQVHQPAPHRTGRRTVPAGGRDRRRSRRRPAGRSRAVPAEPGRAAPVRRADRVDQRRQPVAVGDPGRRDHPVPGRGGCDPGAGHAAARRGRHHAVLPERAERPADVAARQHARPVPAHRLLRADRAVPAHRPGRGTPRRRRRAPRRPAPAGDRGQDVRAGRRAARRPGPHLGPGPLGRQGQPLAPARLPAPAEPVPAHRRQPDRPLGLRPVDPRPGRRRQPVGRPGAEPAPRPRRRPGRAAAGTRRAAPVGGARGVRGHPARQRRRLPVPGGRAARVPVPDPQRLRGPGAQPPALPGRLGRRRCGPTTAARPTRTPARCRWSRRYARPGGPRTGRWTGATAACPTRPPPDPS